LPVSTRVPDRAVLFNARASVKMGVMPMQHENLKSAIDGLSARIIAIRDSL
jgi:hypothetical protein